MRNSTKFIALAKLDYMKYYLNYFFIILFICHGCKSFEATTYDYPRPVDTQTKPISVQEKKVYAIDGVYADNQFDGARLNDFEKTGENSFQVLIEPENSPINSSPYYAFKIWADANKDIALKLHYSQAKHRYAPKISTNGKDWQLLDSTKIVFDADSVDATLSLSISNDTLWVAAQEVQNSTHVRGWVNEMAKHPDATFSVVGQSKLGRDMLHLDIGKGNAESKDVIAIISRQHPPEVTGYLALQAFIEEIMADNVLSNAFREKYRVLLYPLMNPDGVDMGHWRHNAGGIDLNRDWAYYHQPETRTVANHIVATSKRAKSNVILGLDFHSTYYDIYYTFDETLISQIHGFKDYWLKGIDDGIPNYHPHDAPAPLGGPVSKNWFYTQLRAEGITYEIGDDTPRGFIKEKGRVSAREMMKLLIMR